MSGERDYAALLAENERLREQLERTEAELWEFDKTTLDEFNFSEWKERLFQQRRKIQTALAAVPEERE